MHPQAGRRRDSQNIGNCAGSAAEVGRPGASDTVKSQCCNLELYPLRHWQPMEDIAKDWFDVLIFSKTNNETVMEVYLVGFEGNESVKDQN